MPWRQLELLEAVDVDDEDGRAAHLDLDRIGYEEVTGFDQGWHRVHEFAAGPAVLLDQAQNLFDAIVLDPGHEGHVLVLQESTGADEASHRDPPVVEGIHRRGGVFAVHHGDQQLHAERRSAGRMPACCRACIVYSRTRWATWSGWLAAS